MEDLQEMRHRDPLARAIVFSQWTSTLDVIQEALNSSQHFKCVRIDGSMNQDDRVCSMYTFKTDIRTNVFLISLMAGNVGLNLLAAEHVFMVDPWWTAAMEHQAVDRVHRIGQSRPVQVTRYFVNNTIEEKVLHLQRTKERLARETFGESRGKFAKVTIQDVVNLFGKRMMFDEDVDGEAETVDEEDENDESGNADLFTGSALDKVELDSDDEMFPEDEVRFDAILTLYSLD
jgi:SNF2 family DNA or RNA helicase